MFVSFFFNSWTISQMWLSLFVLAFFQLLPYYNANALSPPNNFFCVVIWIPNKVRSIFHSLLITFPELFCSSSFSQLLPNTECKSVYSRLLYVSAFLVTFLYVFELFPYVFTFLFSYVWRLFGVTLLSSTPNPSFPMLYTSSTHCVDSRITPKS